jgi:hypothetical protein
MSRERRDWTKQDPVKYFEEHYAGRITVKHQLREKDYGLYQKLSKMGKLEDVLPDSVHRDFSKIDAVVYFSEHYAGRITTPGQLQKEDSGLFQKLRKMGKLDVVFPSDSKKQLEDLMDDFGGAQ